MSVLAIDCCLSVYESIELREDEDCDDRHQNGMTRTEYRTKTNVHEELRSR